MSFWLHCYLSQRLCGLDLTSPFCSSFSQILGDKQSKQHVFEHTLQTMQAQSAWLLFSKRAQACAFFTWQWTAHGHKHIQAYPSVTGFQEVSCVTESSSSLRLSECQNCMPSQLQRSNQQMLFVGKTQIRSLAKVWFTAHVSCQFVFKEDKKKRS